MKPYSLPFQSYMDFFNKIAGHQITKVAAIRPFLMGSKNYPDKKSLPCWYPSTGLSFWKVTQKSISDAKNFLSPSEKIFTHKKKNSGNCLKRPQNHFGQNRKFSIFVPPQFGGPDALGPKCLMPLDSPWVVSYRCVIHYEAIFLTVSELYGLL